MDYLLRTNTELDMDNALKEAGILHEITNAEGETLLVPVNGVSVDYIGVIQPLYDVDTGDVIDPGDQRFHANLRVTFDLSQEQLEKLPTFEPLPTYQRRGFL